MKSAARSSASPPISPTITISSVSSSSSNRVRMSMKSEPTMGSPPIPTILELPAPPVGRRGADPGPLKLIADLVGQRPGLGDDADRALLEELGGDDPDVRLPGAEHAGAVRADQPDPGVTRLPVGGEHVVDRDVLGDRDDRADAGVDSLVDRGGGEP